MAALRAWPVFEKLVAVRWLTEQAAHDEVQQASLLVRRAENLLQLVHIGLRKTQAPLSLAVPCRMHTGSRR